MDPFVVKYLPSSREISVLSLDCTVALVLLEGVVAADAVTDIIEKQVTITRIIDTILVRVLRFFTVNSILSLFKIFLLFICMFVNL